MFQQEWLQIIKAGGELMQMIFDYEEESGSELHSQTNTETETC